MAIWVAFIRGINIGGHHKIPMEVLRRLFEECACRNPQTYIQSGNVVFESAARNPAALTARIETAIESVFGFRPDTILRTAGQLRAIVECNPFPAEAASAPSKLAVSFLSDPPAVSEDLDLSPYAPSGEQVRLIGQELYLYFPDGMGRSKFRMPALERVLAGPGGQRNTSTARNWNTVTTLLAMAEARG